MLLQCFFLDVVWDFYFFPSHLFFLSLSLVYAICFIIFSSPSPIFSFCTVLTTLPPLCHIGQSSSLSFLLRLPPSLLSVGHPLHLPLRLLSATQFIGSCSLIYQSNSSFAAAFGGEREEKPQAAFLKKPVAARGINMRSLGRCRFSLKLTFKLFHKYEIKPRAQMGLHPLLL